MGTPLLFHTTYLLQHHTMPLLQLHTTPLLQLHTTPLLQLHTTPQFMLKGPLTMPHLYTGMNMLLQMTTARLTLVQMRLVMVTRHLAHIVLPFPMVAPRLSTIMSTMLILAMLLTFPMKDKLLIHLPQYTKQRTSQLQLTSQLQSFLSMPRQHVISIDVIII